MRRPESWLVTDYDLSEMLELIFCRCWFVICDIVIVVWFEYRCLCAFGRCMLGGII